MKPEFKPFPKLARLFRECTITEKIDGTNAQVVVTDFGDVYAGSRTRWITPEDDNYGFAAWVEQNKDELRKLGPGQHFGEWWGQGIQRRYGLTERRFSLFNTSRWGESRPECCHVVPVLYQGAFDSNFVRDCLHRLRAEGSVAAPGFMDPEGVVVFHPASGRLFKVTCNNDGQPKSLVNAA